MPEKEDGQLVGDFPFVPKQERAHKKRDALLESGKCLFIKKGYEQTTAKDIASHAGVATGTFYRYFSDKRQLLMSLLEDQLEKLMPQETNWIKRNPEILASLLEKHYKRLTNTGILRVLPELLPKDPELTQVLLKARIKFHSRIIEGLELLSVKGETWQDLDFDTVAWTVLVMIENGPQKEAHSGQPMNYLEMAKVISRIVFPPEK